ncbi:MAG: XdhC family protein [Rhodothalassiaceae bacterium]
MSGDDSAVLAQANHWAESGQGVALAWVVEAWGSAPRRPGAVLAVAADGRFEGSVSGGCVEADVLAAAQTVIETGQPQLLHFGVSADQAWAAGLACGGQISVFVEPVTPATEP